MRVRFTKLTGRRYRVAVDRAHGPRLEPRNGPGYDELLPHDLAHFAVEEQLGLRLGVFGQLAAGGSGLFAPAPADRRLADRRADRRLAAAGRADMCRSESAVDRASPRGVAAPGVGRSGPAPTCRRRPWTASCPGWTSCRSPGARSHRVGR